MPEAPEDTLVVYSDYVCPFCYLGKASLEAYADQAEAMPTVEMRPFDLRSGKRGKDHAIDPTAEDWKDEAYYERARANVERLAEAYGVEMVQELPGEVDSWQAHKVALAIQRSEAHGAGVLARWHDAVFEALWEQGRDIGQAEVLAELGEAVGLAATFVGDALGSTALDEDLEAAFQESQRAGVTGVPTFAYGELAIPGAIPPEHIGKLLENG